MDPEVATENGLLWGRSIDPMVPIVGSILEVHRETRDTFTLALDLSEQAGDLSFHPGQFCMLYAFGAGEVPISISGDPGDPMKLVHTIRAVGGVTGRMQSMKAGESLGIRGPFGTPWPVAEAQGKDLILVAGGIGLAPLRPLIYHIRKKRSDYGKLLICYGARSPDDLLYIDELNEWRSCPDIDFRVTVDHGSGQWRGNVGVVTALMQYFTGHPDNTLAILCGPEVMMRFSIRELNAMGIFDERIFVSMERNMHCATGFCGHCQFGPTFICKDGPVFRFDRIKATFRVREC